MEPSGRIPLLTLGFSTMRERLEQTIEIASRVRAAIPDSEAVVVSQGEAIDEVLSEDGLRTVRTVERGLSRSRNMVISHASGRYIWFLDDDLEFSPENILRASESLSKGECDVYLAQIGCRGDRSRFYKNYHRLTPGPFLKCLRASSVEIIVKREFLDRSRVRFCEDLGLGTQLPSCEENVFLLDCLKAGGGLTRMDLPLCFHDCSRAGRMEISRGHYVARGVVIGRMPILYRLPLLAFWTLKAKGMVRRGEALACMIGGLAGGAAAKP